MCFFVVIMLFGMVDMVVAAPIQWDVNDHLYERININLNWHDAKTYCENIGGYLATLTSKEENDFVYNNLGNGWLGGTDEKNEGTWEWITGEIWDYTNWSPGNPNDHYGSGQDYLKFYSIYPGQWDDDGLPAFPNRKYDFICEWNPVPIPGTLCLLCSGLLGFAGIRKKFCN